MRNYYSIERTPHLKEEVFLFVIKELEWVDILTLIIGVVIRKVHPNLSFRDFCFPTTVIKSDLHFGLSKGDIVQIRILD